MTLLKIKKISEKEKNLFFEMYLIYFKEITKNKKINDKKIYLIYLRIVKDLKKKVLLIRYNHEIIGFFIINYAINVNGNKVCYINDLFLKKIFRKKGFAHTVVKKFISNSKKKGIKQFRIEVLKQNDKIMSFWNNFKPIEKSTNYIID